jgi:hypothetical protein
VEAFEEDRAMQVLRARLDELGAAHPDLEIGFFDLDFDSFVHRAVVRALTQTGMPTANYSERTYSAGAGAIPAARAPLDSLGLPAPLIAGLQLKGFLPPDLPGAIFPVLDAAEGYFVFTSYSLWQDPSRLSGAYALSGTQAD